MRILIVTHRYPPDSGAGVETYAARTAALLQARGHDVVVLTTVKDVARTDLSVHRREHGGVEVIEVTNNLFATRFEETWSHPALEDVVAPLLDEVAPDVAHVHHLLYLSVGLLDQLKRRDVPVILTLHDFWVGCARFGQLLHPDGMRCEGVDPARCGTCLPSLQWRQTDAARRVAKAVALVMRAASIDLKAPLARRHRRTLGSAAWTPPDPEEAAEYATLSERRMSEIVAAVNRGATRILLPSAFQRPWFESHGVRGDLMQIQRTGVDWDEACSVPRVERAAGDPLRFLFLGTLVPHKGAHVLLEAWRGVREQLAGRATLSIFGPDDNRPDYVAELRPVAVELGVTLGGRLDRAGVQEALARADVLVVPSVWIEVRPLVMIEAFAQGARVLASDLGGMAEVIADGVPGATFPAGDAGALGEALVAEVRRAEAGDAGPGQDLAGSSMGASVGASVGEPGAPEAFPSWDDVAAALERHSREVAGGGGSAPSGPLT